MGVETAISAGSSLLGAGASLLGGSNGSAAAESANRDAQYNASQDRLALMMGFANAYNDFQNNNQNAIASLARGYGDIQNYGDLAQQSLANAGNYWDTAKSEGTGYLNNALSEWDSKYNQVRADESPYMALGQQGVAGYSGLLTNPSSITSDPGYQFGLSQGVNALDRSAAAKGLLLSGSQQKALDQYGQDYGQTYLDKVMGRYQTAIGDGQTATTQVNNAGMTTAAGKSNVYNALSNLGLMTASGKSGLSQASSNAYLNTGNALNQNTTSQANDWNNLSSLINSLWSNTANNLTKVDSGSSEASGQAASAEASSENSGISGAVNSINSGVKNYLTSSGYGTGGSNSLANSYTYGGGYYGATPWGR